MSSINFADSSARPFNVLTGYNLGNNTLLFSLPVHQLYELSAVANERGLTEVGQQGQPIAQRRLDINHATKLAVYMIKGFVGALVKRQMRSGIAMTPELFDIQRRLGAQPYMSLQPITANLRTVPADGSSLKIQNIAPGLVTVFLSDKDVFWIVDGQHRRYAMDLVFEFLKEIRVDHKYSRKPKLIETESGYEMSQAELDVWLEVYEIARTECRIMVELHLGLDASQERQLFHDLNNLSKRVETGLAFKFDSANPVNLFIKTQLVDREIIKVVERDIADDSGALTLKDVAAVNSILFLNKTNFRGAKNGDVEAKSKVAESFWAAVSQIEGFGKPQARQKTVAAQPVVLKALAKLTYDFAFKEKDQESLQRLLAEIPKLDFSPTNPLWRFYQTPDKDRSQFRGLAKYLPEHGAPRDLGHYDDKAKSMMFSPKHNDTYPIIGDMIRWKLKLPNRQQAEARQAA